MQQILKLNLPESPDILEVGCGTGRNLRYLASSPRLSRAQITGIDISREMLNVARRSLPSHPNLSLINGGYGLGSTSFPKQDLIILSYTLTMAGENAPGILETVRQDLKPGGYIAVVDFHTTPFRWFSQWMEFNHVVLGGTLLPELKRRFEPIEIQQKRAYLGLWSYFRFMGKTGKDE